MDKKHYPTAFMVVIAFALFIMYGDMFSLKQVDFTAYKEACNKYRSAKIGAHSMEEIQSLVNNVNYLLPSSVMEIKDPLKKEVKICSNELALRLAKKALK